MVTDDKNWENFPYEDPDALKRRIKELEKELDGAPDWIERYSEYYDEET